MDTCRSHNVLFFAGLLTALLMPLTYGQETESKGSFLLEPYANADLREHQPARKPSKFVENQMRPTWRRHHSTHLGVLYGEALPSDLVAGQSSSESDSVGQHFLQTGKSSRTDFSGEHTSHFHPSEFGDEESMRDTDPVFSENKKFSDYRLKHGFKERLHPSSQSRRRISPHLMPLPFSHEDLVDLERNDARFSENTQDTQRDASHAVFNEERHQPLQTGETLSDARERRSWESFYDQKHHDFSRVPRHQEEGQSSMQNSEELFREDFPYESGSSFDTEDDAPNSYPKHQSSSNSEHYPEQTLMSRSHNFGEKHETEDFAFESDDSSLNSEREVFHHHNPSLRGEHFNEKLEEPYYGSDSSDGGEHYINSGLQHSLRTGHFPEDPITNSDTLQETKHDYPPLDICSEETHVFHNEAISPSSPVYETEVFLPLNFSKVFHNELLDKIHEYEIQNFPPEGEICNTRRKRFYDTDSLNVRSMCPFRWEVTDYHPARYPPHLMSARCSCQGSKFLYGQQSICTERKGRVPVLWRVGCNNGRHVYREGWQEINVACVPLGFVWQTGGPMTQDGDSRPSV